MSKTFVKALAVRTVALGALVGLVAGLLFFTRAGLAALPLAEWSVAPLVGLALVAMSAVLAGLATLGRPLALAGLPVAVLAGLAVLVIAVLAGLAVLAALAGPNPLALALLTVVTMTAWVMNDAIQEYFDVAEDP